MKIVADNNESDWKEAQHARRLRQRRLPRGLREDVAKVRRDDLAHEVLDLIETAVRTQAERFARMITVRGELHSWHAVAPVVARKILRTLNTDAAFRGHVRHAIAGLLRTEHLLKTNPAATISVPELSSCPPQANGGVLLMRSSIGLGSASYLEAEPEEWCHYVVSSAIGRWISEDEEDVTFERRGRSLLAIGAGPGGIARVLTGLETAVRVEVSEQDNVLPEATALSCVHEQRGPSDRMHDVVVVVLPCPATSGSANHRRIYRQDHAREFDLSGIEASKWMLYVGAWMDALVQLVSRDGEAFVLAPASARRESRYAEEPALLDALLTGIEGAGMAIVEQHRVIEVDSVNQPFVGRARPTRWSLRLRHRAEIIASEECHA